jgi:hypothetical protein
MIQNINYLQKLLIVILTKIKCIHICHEPLISPITHNDCGNSFCKDCITKLLYKWPICRKGSNSEFVEVKIRALLNQLDRIKVKCNICLREVNRGDFKEHIRICMFKCPLDCGIKINIKSLEQHKTECVNNIVYCSTSNIGCDIKIKRKDLENHLKVCIWIMFKPIIDNFYNKFNLQSQTINSK